MDAPLRQILAFHGGDRSRASAKALWGAIPESYQEHATFHPDQDAVCNGVRPAERYKAINEERAENRSGRTVQHPLEATPFTPRVRPLVLLQAGRAPHRCHHILHLPLQPGESGSITRVALPDGAHLQSEPHVQRTVKAAVCL